MYDFIDTNEIQSKKTLPAEAMSFNGVFIENEIAGYRTLYVSGRELMESEIQDETINFIDGANFLGRQYPARTITVTYQLIAKTDLEFREAFNKLNLLLKGEQVKIFFNDEPDKYFIGTKVGNSDPTPGSNNAIGTIEIYCSDPFKYSSTLKEFTPELKDGVLEATVVNGGSVPVTVDYEITHNAESGYIGIVSEKGAMQFGKIDEIDKEPYKQNETLVSLTDFINAQNDKGTDYLHPLYGTQGTLTTKNWFNTTFLAFGTKGTTVGSANGGLRTIVIPADSEGAKGAKNWYAYFHVIFYAVLMGQTGEMAVSFLTEDNKVIAAYNWHKGDTTGNTAYCEFIGYDPDLKQNAMPAGKILKQWTYTTSHLQNQNPWYWDWGHCDIRKEGSKLTFFYWAKYYSFIIPEIENMECAKIQISIKQWGDRGGAQLMTYMGFDKLTFSKMNVEKWNDIPNRYQPNDVCAINGADTKYYVNGMYRADDEILGSQYFKVDPGETTIRFYTSEWTSTPPTIKIRIREAWL